MGSREINGRGRRRGGSGNGGRSEASCGRASGRRAPGDGLIVSRGGEVSMSEGQRPERKGDGLSQGQPPRKQTASSSSVGLEFLLACSRRPGPSASAGVRAACFRPKGGPSCTTARNRRLSRVASMDARAMHAATRPRPDTTIMSHPASGRPLSTTRLATCQTQAR
jgi:hypothetical protein